MIKFILSSVMFCVIIFLLFSIVLGFDAIQWNDDFKSGFLWSSIIGIFLCLIIFSMENGKDDK